MTGRQDRKKDPYGASHEKNAFGYCIFKYIPYICTTKTVCAVMVPVNPLGLEPRTPTLKVLCSTC